MNLASTVALRAYGTSEGVKKEWDTRGRGRKQEVKYLVNPPKSAFETGKPINVIGYHNSEGAEELKMGRRGIFFAESPAPDYGSITHRAEIRMQNPFVAEEQVDAAIKLWPGVQQGKDGPPDVQKLLGENPDPEEIGTPEWWGTMDRAITTELKLRGHDGLVYTDPEALSQREYAVFDKSQFNINFVGENSKWIDKYPAEAKASSWAKYVKKGNDANSMSLDAAIGKLDLAEALKVKHKHKALSIMVKHMKISAAVAMQAASQFGTTGWQYGRNIARDVGYVPAKTYGGFPSPAGGINKGRSGTVKPHATGRIARPRAIKGPNVHKPNPSGHAALNVRKPNLSIHHLEGETIPKLKADIGGEPMTGNMGHFHMEPNVWFHPPSLQKRNSKESLRVPTDDPGESKDKFLG